MHDTFFVSVGKYNIFFMKLNLENRKAHLKLLVELIPLLQRDILTLTVIVNNFLSVVLILFLLAGP